MLYIGPVELKGDLNKRESIATLIKRDPKVLRPYLDYKKLWTVGVGHLIGNGSNEALIRYKQDRARRGLPLAMSIKEVEDLYYKDVSTRHDFVQRYFKNEWDRFSDDLKSAIIDIHFRGDLINKHNPSKPFNWVRLLKQGMYKEAGREYLDHKEYKNAIAKGGSGVITRMNRNKVIFDREAETQNNNLQ
jgi:hypothetical protein